MAAVQVTDIQRVWRLVQELSAQLKTNQQETERLRRYVEHNPPTNVVNRPPSTNGTTNGESDSDESSLVNEIANVRHAYSVLLDENASLKIENDELSQLCAEYEIGLTKTMDQIRTHEYQVTTSTLVLHKNYASQLDSAKELNQALQDENVAMQGQLNKLSSLVRDALENFTDVESESIIEALRIENEALRSRLEALDDEIESDKDLPST